MPLRRRWFALSLLVLAGAACSDREAAERKAFITFLKTRIVDRPGVHVPIPSADDNRTFGRYADHYTIIRSFNEALNQGIGGPFAQLVAKAPIRSLSDLVQRRGELRVVKEGAAGLRATMDRELAKASAAHAALQQPEDLKAVYDAAFERTVTAPARLYVEVFPALERTLQAAEDLAAFLERNGDRVRVSGIQVELRDATLKTELDALLARLQAEARSIQEAQQKLQALVRG